jgi:hypothetical protein
MGLNNYKVCHGKAGPGLARHGEARRGKGYLSICNAKGKMSNLTQQQALNFDQIPMSLSKEVFLKMNSIKQVARWMISISGIADLDDLAQRLNREMKTKYRSNDISKWLSDNPNDPRNFPAEVLIPLQKILNCNYILEWEAYQLDHEIRPAQSAQERRILELEAQVMEKDREKDLMLKLVREMKGV